jgi:hypothetical protein
MVASVSCGRKKKPTMEKKEMGGGDGCYYYW